MVGASRHRAEFRTGPRHGWRELWQISSADPVLGDARNRLKGNDVRGRRRHPRRLARPLRTQVPTLLVLGAKLTRKGDRGSWLQGARCKPRKGECRIRKTSRTVGGRLAAGHSYPLLTNGRETSGPLYLYAVTRPRRTHTRSARKARVSASAA